MGNIGPTRQRYEVLSVPAFGIEDADLWRLDTRREPLTSESVDVRDTDVPRDSPARPKA